MTDSEKLDKLIETVVQMQERFDKIDNKLEVMEIRQNKMSDQLTELQLSQKIFELNTNKKLARLQDGMDTIEEIRKLPKKKNRRHGFLHARQSFSLQSGNRFMISLPFSSGA